jgi:hypothetical protein
MTLLPHYRHVSVRRAARGLIEAYARLPQSADYAPVEWALQLALLIETRDHQDVAERYLLQAASDVDAYVNHTTSDPPAA